MIPELITVCHATELDAAHDRLSDLLEDSNASPADIRDAAIKICAALNSHFETRRIAMIHAMQTQRKKQ